MPVEDGAFRAALADMRIQANAAARVAASSGAEVIERHIQAKLSMYSHSRGTPTPSPPGAPPARVSGGLVGSLTFDVRQLGFGIYESRTGPTAVYSRIQELGGRGHNSTLPARPYTAPGLDESMAELEAISTAVYAAVAGL